MLDYIKIHENDTVVVANKRLSTGSKIKEKDTEIIVKEEIPTGHKVAICKIGVGEAVLKYGMCIGYATSEILPGMWVHTHNLKTGLSDLLDYTYHPQTIVMPAAKQRTFLGYQRKDNTYGIRNELWIVPTVGCLNSVILEIKRRASEKLLGLVDSVKAFPHPYGCSQMGEDQENTRRILAGLIRHPNAGGVLVVGLGCENSGVEEIKKYLGPYDANRVKFMVCQEEKDELLTAERLLKELSEYASSFHRTKLPCKELIIGLKCGGSDGFSGITANPMVGRFSDLLVADGGTAILTEVPEMFGAETLLMNRCASKEIFDQTVLMINGFKQYFKQNHQTIYENPSPGNKAGGISTLEDKSLGCIQKSGSAPIKGVLDYGSYVTRKGLNLLNAPGNDLVASTALAVAGAQMVLFTTGRGTPFACPVPTVKISTNTDLFERKNNWIDFDAGSILKGASVSDLADEFMAFVLSVASGRQSKAELAGFHDMAILKQGVTL